MKIIRLSEDAWTLLLCHLLLLYNYVECYTFTNPESSFLHFKQWDTTQTGILRFKFKTSKPYGLLMYSDNSKESSGIDNYISLKLALGKISLTIQYGEEDHKSKRTILIGKSLNDLQWHTVEIIKYSKQPRRTTINVDDYTKDILNDGKYDTLRLNSGLYFGGISEDLQKDIVDGSIKIQPR